MGGGGGRLVVGGRAAEVDERRPLKRRLCQPSRQEAVTWTKQWIYFSEKGIYFGGRIYYSDLKGKRDGIMLGKHSGYFVSEGSYNPTRQRPSIS